MMHLGKLLPCCIEANVYNNHISAETFFEIYTVYTYASYTLLHRSKLNVETLLSLFEGNLSTFLCDI